MYNYCVKIIGMKFCMQNVDIFHDILQDWKLVMHIIFICNINEFYMKFHIRTL